MIGLAALSGPLPKAGIVVAAAVVAVALLHPDARARAWAMLGALLLAPALLLADIWHSPQLEIVHRHPLVAVAGAAVALGAVAVAALVVGRRPALLAGAVLIALPFRIPIQAGGQTKPADPRASRLLRLCGSRRSEERKGERQRNRCPPPTHSVTIRQPSSRCPTPC